MGEEIRVGGDEGVVEARLVERFGEIIVGIYEIIAEPSSRMRPCNRWMLDKLAPVPFWISKNEVR